MQWINLSKKFPADWERKHMRYASDHYVLETSLFEHINDGLVKIGGTGRLEYNEVEWLDETLSPIQTGMTKEGAVKELYTKIHCLLLEVHPEIVEDILKSVDAVCLCKGDAVELLELVSTTIRDYIIKKPIDDFGLDQVELAEEIIKLLPDNSTDPIEFSKWQLKEGIKFSSFKEAFVWNNVRYTINELYYYWNKNIKPR